MVFGLIMIFSASSISATLQYGQTEYYFFRKQIIIIIIGLFLAAFFIFVPKRLLKVIGLVGIYGMIGVLLLLRTYGTVTNSAKSWFTLPFGFSVQPSEISKLFVILFLAYSYGSKKKIKNTQDLLIPLIPCVIIVFLVLSEPDFGTATIITVITAFIFFALPIEKNKVMQLLKALAFIGVVLGFLFLNNSSEFLTKTQASRFNFKNPCSRYLEDTGYQVCNGYIAINNGGLLGVGLGNSTQKYLYLPEAHTDFIFPIIVEELGLIGGLLVLIAYIILLYSILNIACNASNLTGSLIAFGTFSYILTHVVINIGGLLALIPLTGVPLPFLSYGGSYMLVLLSLLGLTQRVAIETKEHKYKAELKKTIGG
jgi:cell division protein FtsW